MEIDAVGRAQVAHDGARHSQCGKAKSGCCWNRNYALAAITVRLAIALAIVQLLGGSKLLKIVHLI